MIGLVTIGQAPRDDIVASMFPPCAVPPLIEAGALDGVSRNEIDDLYPGADEHLLVTRLGDGSEVTISKQRVMSLMQRAIDRVEAMRVSVICVLCTGTFEGLVANTPLVFPDRVLQGLVDGIAPQGTLGVLMPHTAQHEFMLAKWGRPGRNVVTSATSPYADGADHRTAAASLVDRGAELIVMDCMGFDREMQSIVRQEVGVPVVLSNALLGAVLLETFGRRVD